MKITPKSEKELQSRHLMDPGTYSFVVLKSEEKVSKNSGYPMIELVVRVTDMNNREHVIYDYLIDKEPMDYKIRHIYDCAGLIDKYETGELDASDLLDVKGKVKVIIRKDKSGKFGDRNSIQDYIVCSQVDFEDDKELPF